MALTARWLVRRELPLQSQQMVSVPVCPVMTCAHGLLNMYVACAMCQGGESSVLLLLYSRVAESGGYP